jgi:CheY-like chemotaxis protein
VPLTAGAGPLSRAALLVEDEPLVRQATAMLLRRLGFEVVAVEDGASALARVRGDGRDRTPPIVVAVIDVLMPGIDGVETAMGLQAIAGPLPVVLCSGYVAPDRVAQLAPIAPYAFLHKPFTRRELALALAKVLGDAPALTV